MTDSDIVIDQLKTLSLQSKLVLCACIRLLSSDNDAKITVTDVFTKYKQLTARFNINWLSLGKVTEYIKELEMLGFLKCTYPNKGHVHQIRYVHIFEPAEIPRYTAVLQEDLRKDTRDPLAK
jgi:Cdc6-like AAA superfamily ATPase